MADSPTKTRRSRAGSEAHAVPATDRAATSSSSPDDVIFEPLEFRNLTVPNRIFRSSISGRFDNYDGSGTQVRIDWDVKFARGGVGAIISSNTPVHPQGLIVPNYAHLDEDSKTPFWRELGRRVREHGAKYIVQLAFSGRQRDIGGVVYPKGLSSTDKPEPVHGFPCERMTVDQIREIVEAFAQAARRAREAELDGIEIHGCNGYLITQFLSPAINDRDDEYGGSLENRARFPLEVVRAVRREVGPDFHLQFKISAVDDHDALFPWWRAGTTLQESVQVCKWLEQAGVDGFHVSNGSAFPHPRNPAGSFPISDVIRSYDTMLSSGKYTFRNYLMFRTPPINRLFKWLWERRVRRLGGVEGINLPEARAIKQAVNVPVIALGGFQTASLIRAAMERGDCDAVSMGRPLIANPDVVNMFAAGLDRAPKPCTYCNKCLINFVENPLGCYEEARFDSREQMLRQILSVYEGAPLPPEVKGAPMSWDARAVSGRADG
jgi:2,4-dienoyl-CoA reductase-like NADH-dependent reductase (Old Yellow Enzyme family)